MKGMNLKFILSCLILSLFAIETSADIVQKHVDTDSCIDNNACPKVLEISLVDLIKSKSIKKNKLSNEMLTSSIELAFPLLIKNRSKRTLTTVIAITHNGNKVNCGVFNVPGNSSVTGDIACNVGGLPYNIQDSDGRSNTITVSNSGDSEGGGGLCEGKTINDECLNGIIYNTDGVNGLIVSKDDNFGLPWISSMCSETYLGTAIGNDDGYSGKSNTDIIIAACGTSNDYAAGYCRSLGPEWYLPASTQTTGIDPPNNSELNDLRIAASSGLIPAANILLAFYWSSSESAANSNPFARVQFFSNTVQDGLQAQGGKRFTNVYSTRCIRPF